MTEIESASRKDHRPDASHVLDPLAFPLRGARLIEASAGTGKTWAIAALYVRLVLGHGGAEAGFGRGLLPPEILVVTFTEAATKELRDRIRKRLAEAARCFRGLAQPDGFLERLAADYAVEAHPACARQLEVAAQWMDEAAVYTIHGWCNRMLRQHAFDSGSLFNLEIETQDAEWLEEVARDYWRNFFYPLDAAASQAVAQLADSPKTLLAEVQGLLREAEAQWRVGEQIFDVVDEPQVLLRRWSKWEARRKALETPARLAWAEGHAAIAAMLVEASANGWLNGTSYPKAHFQTRLQALEEWATQGAECKREWLEGFAQSRIKMNKAHQDKQPRHPAFVALDALAGHLGQAPEFKREVFVHAARWMRVRFAEEKQRRARMGFDDLLTHLDQALQRQPAGTRLAEAIGRQYPVALIDEFQDTDPVQYRIFDGVYKVKENRETTGLFIIGDPKQAIYSFRGADIHTYLKARLATQGRHYSLERNFRSTEAMVAAVNRFFAHAEAQPGGAFQFKTEAGGNPVPFHVVQAEGRAEQWWCEGQSSFPLCERGSEGDLSIPCHTTQEIPPDPPFAKRGGRLIGGEGQAQAALTLWHLPPEEEEAAISITAYRHAMAEAAASEITRLLNQSAQGRAGFQAGAQFQPLKPADLAILVRDRTEADIMRRALSARRIRSVYLSERESVFDTDEATDMLHWLHACAEPERDRALRAALGTATLDLGYAELEVLNSDELRWESEVERFRAYRKIWRYQGVLPMLRRLMAEFDVPARLLRRPDGERRLTNLLHLAELLQAASVELDGEQALLRHLAEAREDGARASGETLLRLESDADLVKVVSIHKSKGLEYPLVFLPFICSFKEINAARKTYYRYHDSLGIPQIDLGKTDAAKRQAERERLQEDLRLLYVALTRARHACWLGMAAVKAGNAKACQLDKSAIGQVLNGGQAITAEELGGLLLALKGDCAAIAVTLPPRPDDTVYSPLAGELDLQAARTFDGRIADYWWIASYSALKIDEEGVDAADLTPGRLGEAPDTPRQANLEEAGDEAEVPPLPVVGGYTMHRFPRGAKPGTFLHGLLEWAAEEGFGHVARADSERKDAVARRCHTRGWVKWVNLLSDWMGQLLATPMALPDGPVALADLDRSAYQAELEFWLASSRVDTLALDRLVTRHTLQALPRPKLLPNQVNGMLKGFIDLVFAHEGRHYVVDYKSNWLGADDAAYTPEAMREAVLESRYELQYTLYLLALHRQLKIRLRETYDYDRHIGGAVYIFLRGLDGPAGGLHLEKPPRALIEALDALFDGQRELNDVA